MFPITTFVQMQRYQSFPDMLTNRPGELQR